MGRGTAAHMATPRAICSFRLEGMPVPKARPRVGKHGNIYTPRKTRSYERDIGWTAKLSMGARKPSSKPIEITITAYLPAGKRVDIDNILKSVLDGCNKIVWLDDSQVVQAEIIRLESEDPCVSVTIWEGDRAAVKQRKSLVAVME